MRHDRRWRRSVAHLLIAVAAGTLLSACAALTADTPAADTAPEDPTGRPGRAAARRPVPLPELFESEDWIVTVFKPGDTTESLAARFLGDPARAWMIEDYNDGATFAPGQAVVIPKRPWNLAGVDVSGYQLVPILVYHDIGPQPRGRMLVGLKTFEEQMRFLKTEGYRAIGLAEFYEFISLNRQLPKKAVVLTFDDGYRSFLLYAYPILKELGFTATLFVYTDYVGAGRNALGWEELARLAGEGFHVEGHSKTHSDLRRRPGESDADHTRRVKTEMELPQKLFQQRLGQPARFLAYPYGAVDDAVVRIAQEHGYVGAFTVFREGNSAFVSPYRIRRSQIYSEMTLEDFARNLTIFSQENLK